MTDSYRVPVCFDDVEQWREYQKAWRLSKGNTKINYCNDCTPEFQHRMVVEQRCAHPRTNFEVKGGELIGVRPKEEGEGKRRRGFILNGVLIR